MSKYVMTLQYRNYKESYIVNKDQKRLVELIKNEWLDSGTTVKFLELDVDVIDATAVEEDTI